MKSVVTKISLFLLIFNYLYSEEYSYNEIEKDSSYKFYDVDVNKDGIKDKVAYNLNGNELLFFIKFKDKYKNIYQGDNYSFDGLYILKDIMQSIDNNYTIIISTIFGGAGGETKDYFIKYQDNQWILKKIITTTSTYTLDVICEWYSDNNKEICNEVNKHTYKFKIQFPKQPLYEEPNENTKTKMYLIKDDIIEILEEKEDWIYILYISKDNKEIKAWIPKKALENE